MTHKTLSLATNFILYWKQIKIIIQKKQCTTYKYSNQFLKLCSIALSSSQTFTIDTHCTINRINSSSLHRWSFSYCRWKQKQHLFLHIFCFYLQSKTKQAADWEAVIQLTMLLIYSQHWGPTAEVPPWNGQEYEGESISNQLNLFPVAIRPFVWCTWTNGVQIQ